MEEFLPTGFSDYKEFIESNFVYIDKTLFIQELLSKGRGLRLICRPRRFGKTMNLSMLRYFFEKTEESNAHLFTDKKIWQYEECRLSQGQYPVIFITFKEVKEDNWEDAYNECVSVIVEEFIRHRPFIMQHKALIDPTYLAQFTRIVNNDGTYLDIKKSLKLLIELLHTITKKTVFLLIDEYDAPIHSAFENNYYKKMVTFIRSMFSAALKDNAQVEQAVLTGILRTSKEGIFSGLNNLNVFTLLSNQFADKFGFVEGEVNAFLKAQKIDVSMEDIKRWYNGYRAGKDTLLYNPWSIIGCASNNGAFDTYWANTSNNALIKKLITRSNVSLKKELESLLENDPINKKPVTKIIDEAFIFPGIEHNDNAIWSLLLFSGYITYSDPVAEKNEKETDIKKHTLVIPNQEIKKLYNSMLTEIFDNALSTSNMTELFEALLAGEAQEVEEILQEFLLTSSSFHDFPKKKLEQSYHIFVLGLLAFMSSKYHVRSNKEAGFGRYDIMLIPKQRDQVGVLIEFKKADSKTQKAMEAAVKEAFAQIKKKKYMQEFYAHSIEKTIVYGIGVYGKQVSVKSKWVNAKKS